MFFMVTAATTLCKEAGDMAIVHLNSYVMLEE
jgi:hypothetical protein